MCDSSMREQRRMGLGRPEQPKVFPELEPPQSQEGARKRGEGKVTGLSACTTLSPGIISGGKTFPSLKLNICMWP